MKERNPEATCATCPYSREWKEIRLECRRDSPFPEMGGNGAYWPAVKVDDYCGEHPNFWKQD